MKCSKCELNEPDKLIACEECSNIECHGCVGLSTTEVRCVQLKKRILIFKCDTCARKKEQSQNKTNPSNEEKHGGLLNSSDEARNKNSEVGIEILLSLKQDLAKIFQTCVNEFKEEILYKYKRETDDLRKKITHLKDLVKQQDSQLKISLEDASSSTKKSKIENTNTNKGQPQQPTRGNDSNTLRMEEFQKDIMNEIINLAVETATPAESSKSNVEEFQMVSNSKKKELKKTTPSEPATEIRNSYARVTLSTSGQRKKVSPMVGQNAIPANEQKDGFTATPKTKKIWLFVSRASSHVNEKIVKDYLNKKLNNPKYKPEVKALQTRNERQDNNCFMVGLDIELKEIAYDPNFWPTEINVSRFNFYKGKHFLEKQPGIEEQLSAKKNT